MYSIQPVFSNMYGGNHYIFDNILHAYECAKMLFEQEEDVVYVDISSPTFSPRMYRREGSKAFGFKQPWEIPEDEV